MRRRHLFEFGDLQWFPQVLRDAETAYLAIVYRIFPPLPRRWVEKIATVLEPRKPAEIVDLCSGSGGAMAWIVDELEKRGYDARATLTDLYPYPASVSHPRIEWVAEPVDATRVPEKFAGVRTMFSAFHHFRPDAARAILKDAFDRRRSICIFESGPGTLLGAVVAIPMVPPHVLVLMPFARPLRWEYLVFTYLIPILPFILLWDSFVSNLRIYSPEQMKELTEGLDAPDYAWEIGRIAGLVPYLIGTRNRSG